jgi:hypothetical protein
MRDPTSTDLVIRVAKDYTSIGQDDAYMGVKSHTMAEKSPKKLISKKLISSSRKSMNGGKRWWSPKFATVC